MGSKGHHVLFTPELMVAERQLRPEELRAKGGVGSASNDGIRSLRAFSLTAQGL